MIAEEAYVLSKSFTNNSIKGITGALAGKNCTIKSATKTDGVTTVVFAWTADDGTEKTTTIQVNDGAKGDIGIGIDNVTINANSHLIVTLSDGSTIDAGLIQGGSGTDDYENLINRPKIEGVDLIGNKTFEDLGVASATDLAQTDGHLQDLADLVGDKANLPMPNETVVNNIEYLESANKEQFATASGDFITVNDSVDGNIVELGIKGNSFQKTYSGKNLFDCATMFPASAQVSGITLTNNGDGTYTLSGTSTAVAQISKNFTHEQTVKFFKNGAGIYTLSTQELPTIGNIFQCTLAKYNGTDYDYSWRSSPKGKAKSYNITQEMLDNELFFISFMFYIQSGNTINQTFTPQVEFGSSATEYEPYVGGIPSPNPSYPQAINSVGDDGSLVVKSCGKNLAKNANLSTSLTSREVTFVTKSDGTIVVNGTPTQATDSWVWCAGNKNFLLRKGKYLWTGCPTNDGSNKYRLLLRNVEKPWKENNDYGNGVTFELTEDKAFCFFVGISYGYVANNLTFKPMLRRCDDNWIPYGDDLYEPYHETTATIPLSEPLRAIGDIKDEITYQDGKWGVLRRIKEINLSDLSWNLVNNDKYQYWSYSVNDGKEASSYNTIANILAEKYMASSWYNTVRLNSATNAIAYGFNDNNTSAKKVAVHNGSTTESPTGKFLYELVTPVFEPFADQTLPYLSTYDGVTNISNDDALSAEMTMKYPTTDVSGLASRNESRIAKLTKDTDDKLDDVNESLSVIGKCKNLLNPTLQTTTENGVTCTQNVDANGKPDGTYTINGTATDNVAFTVESNVKFNVGQLLCGCPNGGNAEKYYMRFRTNDYAIALTEYGSGVSTNSDLIGIVQIYIRNGITANNLVFKPMITTNLNATYDDFVPYTGDGKTLASDVAEIKNDLGGLSFSASGTTLSITDGTHTWTLGANS